MRWKGPFSRLKGREKIPTGSGPEWQQKAEGKFCPPGEGKAANALPFRDRRLGYRKSVRLLKTKPRYQFRKACKIKRRSEISGLFKTGEKWSCTECTIYSIKNRTSHSRCAIIVSKESGNAVQRNRIKRNVREFFRHSIKNSSLHVDFLVKIHPAKEVKKSKRLLEEELSLWFETVKE